LVPTTLSFTARLPFSTTRLPFSTTRLSGVTGPDTAASPRPKLALTISSSRAPVLGLAVKSTPETSEGTIS